MQFFQATDEEIGEIFLKENICVHLNKFIDKYNCLLLMIDKLLGYVTNKHKADNLDSLAN
jgi:DNA-directed RNA polymerase I subunit RPA2